MSLPNQHNDFDGCGNTSITERYESGWNIICIIYIEYWSGNAVCAALRRRCAKCANLKGRLPFSDRVVRD